MLVCVMVSCPVGAVSRCVEGWMQSSMRPAKRLLKTLDQSHFGESHSPGSLPCLLELITTGMPPRAKAECNVKVLGCRG